MYSFHKDESFLSTISVSISNSPADNVISMPGPVNNDHCFSFLGKPCLPFLAGSTIIPSFSIFKNATRQLMSFSPPSFLRQLNSSQKILDNLCLVRSFSSDIFLLLQFISSS